MAREPVPNAGELLGAALPGRIRSRGLSLRGERPAEQGVESVHSGSPPGLLRPLEAPPHRLLRFARPAEIELGPRERLAGPDREERMVERLGLAQALPQRGGARPRRAEPGVRPSDLCLEQRDLAVALLRQPDRPREGLPGRIEVAGLGFRLPPQRLEVGLLLAVLAFADPDGSGLALLARRLARAELLKRPGLPEGELRQRRPEVRLLRDRDGFVEGLQGGLVVAPILPEEGEVSERDGDRIAEPDFPALLEGAGEGLRRIAPLPRGQLEKAEILLGEHHAPLLADFLAQVERLLPVDEGVVVLAQQEVDVPDVVVALGEEPLVSQTAPDPQRLLVGGEGLAIVPAALADEADVVEHVRLTRPIVETLEDRPRRGEILFGVAGLAQSVGHERAVAQRRGVAPLVAQAPPRFAGLGVVFESPGVVPELLIRGAEGVQDVGPSLLVLEAGLESQGADEVVARGARAVPENGGAAAEHEPDPRIRRVEGDRLLQRGRGLGVMTLRHLRAREVEERLRIERVVRHQLRIVPLGVGRLSLEQRQARSRAIAQTRVLAPGRGGRTTRCLDGRFLAAERLIRRGEGLEGRGKVGVRRDGALERRDGADVVAPQQVLAALLVGARGLERLRAAGVRGEVATLAELLPKRTGEIADGGEESLGGRALPADGRVGMEPRRPRSPEPRFHADALSGPPQVARDEPVDSPQLGELRERARVVFAGSDPQIGEAALQPERIDHAQLRALGESRRQHVRDPGPGPLEARVGRVVGEGQHGDGMPRGGRGRRRGRVGRSRRKRGPAPGNPPRGNSGDHQDERACRKRKGPTCRAPPARAAPVEIGAQSLDVGVSPRWVALEASGDDPHHPRGDRDAELAQIPGPAREPLREHLGLGAGVKRKLPRQHLEEHDAQGIDIGAGVHGISRDLLGREIVRRAHDGSGARPPVARQRAGNAEIGDERPVVGPDENVAGLEVAMHDSGRMGLREALGDLTKDPESALERQRPVLLQDLPKRTSLDVVHREEIAGPRARRCRGCERRCGGSPAGHGPARCETARSRRHRPTGPAGGTSERPARRFPRPARDRRPPSRRGR